MNPSKNNHPSDDSSSEPININSETGVPASSNSPTSGELPTETPIDITSEGAPDASSDSVPAAKKDRKGKSPANTTADHTADSPSNDIVATWRKVSSDLTPEPRKQTLSEKLKPLLGELRGARQRRISWEQLAGRLANPAVGISVTPTTLRRIVGACGTRRSKR